MYNNFSKPEFGVLNNLNGHKLHIYSLLNIVCLILGFAGS